MVSTGAIALGAIHTASRYRVARQREDNNYICFTFTVQKVTDYQAGSEVRGSTGEALQSVIYICQAKRST